MKVTRIAVSLGIIIKLAFHAEPANASDYVRYLLPITVKDAPGAYGSVWTTSLYGVHEEDGFIVRGLDHGLDCPGICGIPMLVPKDTLYRPAFFATAPGEPPGSILYVEASASASVHLGSVIREQTYHAGETGFDIPIVPENRFSAEGQQFVGLTLDPAARTRLRIYSLDLEVANPLVLVQVWTQDRIVAEATFALGVHQRTTKLFNEEFLVRPLAAEMSVDELLRGSLPLFEPLRVRVIPLTTGLRVWSFVSSAYNTDQHVAIFLPD
jgi:hypothetical protein